jgi:hypothetical protein
MSGRKKLITDVQTIVYRYLHRFHLTQVITIYKSTFAIAYSNPHAIANTRRDNFYIYNIKTYKGYNFRFNEPTINYTNIFNVRCVKVAMLPKNYFFSR